MRMPDNRLPIVFAVLLLGGLSYPAHAQFAEGTWVQKSGTMAGQITLKVESCCGGGSRFSYFIKGTPGVAMMIESRLDGKDVPVIVGGKPSGETMAIKRIDARHVATTMTMNGKPFGTSRSTMSEDGKTATVENTTEAFAGQKASKHIEVWVKL